MELGSVGSKLLEAQSSYDDTNPPQYTTTTVMTNSGACLCYILKPKTTMAKCILAFTSLIVMCFLIIGICWNYGIISSILGHLNRTMNEDERMIQGEMLNWNITMDYDTNSYEFEPYFKNGSNLLFDNFLNQIEYV